MQKSGAVQSAFEAHERPEPPKPGFTQMAGDTLPQPGERPICGVPVVNCSFVDVQQLQPGMVVVVVDDVVEDVVSVVVDVVVVVASVVEVVVVAASVVDVVAWVVDVVVVAASVVEVVASVVEVV